MRISKEAEKGQAVYSKLVLAIYDLWVLGITNRFIWKCPTQKLLGLFNEKVTSNHLDVGVGTGYFLERCRFPSESIRLGLMDLNINSLDFAAQRLKYYAPEKYKHNVLEAFDQNIKPFNSISMNYLLHCLPGSFHEKLKVLDNIDHLLNDNGTLFGATILQQDVEMNFLAGKLMNIYNRKGVFSNAHDNIEYLKEFLSRKYKSSKVVIEGCVAIFGATK